MSTDLSQPIYSVADDDGFTDVLALRALFASYKAGDEIFEGFSEFAHVSDDPIVTDEVTIIYRHIFDVAAFNAPEDAQITTPGCMVELRQGPDQETTAIRFVPGVDDPRSRTEAMLYAEIFRGIHCGHSKEEVGEIVQKFVLGGQTLSDFGTAEGIKVDLPKSFVLPHQWKEYAERVHRMAYGSSLGSVTPVHKEAQYVEDAMAAELTEALGSNFTL